MLSHTLEVKQTPLTCLNVFYCEDHKQFLMWNVHSNREFAFLLIFTFEWGIYIFVEFEWGINILYGFYIWIGN